ncbi:hypothetical protein EJB05_11337 [Eragrostis curvula]|uniref:Small nuclear ribonucleoprotein G n=6 Tax=PACMAD clade TaxID=147370 RepID=A0A5J9VSA2_9POAL|nr:hypothetical protein EJB05_11337 [Eragrostis curvula]
MSRSGQPPDLKKYMDKKLQIKLNANRVVIGTLRGFDQFMNLVVDNTVEVNGNDKNDIGMVVIRGNSVVMIEALEPVAKAQKCNVPQFRQPWFDFLLKYYLFHRPLVLRC